MFATVMSQQNQLLATLPSEVQERLHPHLEFVTLPKGSVLHESGAKLRHAYFPIDTIVSLIYDMESGATSAVAIIGNEGMVGIGLFLGGDSTPCRAVTQNNGSALRLNAQNLRDELRREGSLQGVLLRYTQALLTQTTQNAVCNRHHTVEQQLCRWLLLSLDRSATCKLHMTQELIADMLGVRREGVTEAAGKLQRAGVIEYSRGNIAVLDRPALEQRVCECYMIVKNEADRLLPSPLPHHLPFEIEPALARRSLSTRGFVQSAAIVERARW